MVRYHNIIYALHRIRVRDERAGADDAAVQGGLQLARDSRTPGVQPVMLINTIRGRRRLALIADHRSPHARNFPNTNAFPDG